MKSSTDFFLGVFLILSGFALSLINLQRIVKNKTSFQTVLLSENLILTCIGVAFVVRSVYDFSPANIYMGNLEGEAKDVKINLKHFEGTNCNFNMILVTYGPLVVSLVNSFVSLVIDNYMHYRVIEDNNKKEDENMVQEIHKRYNEVTKLNRFNIFQLIKRYFAITASIIQWLVPIIAAISMYPIGMKEKVISRYDLRSLENNCMTMLELSNMTYCSYNYTQELRNIPAEDYLTAYESQNVSAEETTKIKSVIKTINAIVQNFQQDVNNVGQNATKRSPLKRNKSINDKCYKMCLLETKSIILFMFALLVITYFVPITISTIILTKIHTMDVEKPHMSMHLTRELLYSILFWSPVMVDTFLSLILCSYSMNGMRHSMFNVVANVYQAVKNFMNTKHFKFGTVVPA